MGSHASKALGTICLRIAIALLAGLATIIISRNLHPNGRGEYFVVVSIATTSIAFGHLSLEQANVYLWRTSRNQLASNALAIGFASGSLASLTTFLLVSALGPNLVPVPNYQVLGVALLAVPGATILLYVNGLLTLDGRINRVNLAALVGSVVQCGILVTLAALGRLEVSTALVVWTGAMLFPLLLVLPALHLSRSALSMELARRALALGLRYHLGMAALYMLLRIDILLLNAQVDSRQVGLYSLAVTLGEFVHLPTNAIAQVVLPTQVAGNFAEIAQFTARAARFCCLIAVIAIIALLVSGPWIIPLVFGADFADSISALTSLGPGIVALASIRPLGGYLIRLNRPLVMSSAIGIALTLNIALNLLLIPTYGIVGAGLASSAAYLALAGFYSLWFCRSSGLRPTSLLPRPADIADVLLAMRQRGRTGSQRDPQMSGRP